MDSNLWDKNKDYHFFSEIYCVDVVRETRTMA